MGTSPARHGAARGVSFTPEQNETILRRGNNGDTWTDIAKEVGYARRTVQNQYTRLIESRISTGKLMGRWFNG